MPGVADLRVAYVLTSRLDDMSWSIRHQVYRHRFHSRQRIACRIDKRPAIGMCGCRRLAARADAGCVVGCLGEAGAVEFGVPAGWFSELSS